MDIQFLCGTPLFSGLTEEDVRQVLPGLGARQRSFEKGEVILRAEEPAPALGLVLSGSVNVENNDVWGGRTILDNIGPGQVFGETYACLPGEPLMVDVTAAEPAEVLFLQPEKLFQDDLRGAAPMLIRNLLRVTAQKNLVLSRRMFHTSPKTIRERVLSYLSFQARRQGSRRFAIPFDRQELADYLGVDRSALSNELSKMRRDGLIEFNKNRFELKR